MKTIQYNLDTYKIRFMYGVKKGKNFIFGAKALNNIKRKSICTFALISRKTGTTEDGKPVYTDLAGDCSIKMKDDLFSKNVGKSIALKRAVSQLNDRQLRIQIFEAFPNLDLSLTA